MPPIRRRVTYRQLFLLRADKPPRRWILHQPDRLLRRQRPSNLNRISIGVDPRTPRRSSVDLAVRARLHLRPPSILNDRYRRVLQRNDIDAEFAKGGRLGGSDMVAYCTVEGCEPLDIYRINATAINGSFAPPERNAVSQPQL